MAKQDDDEVLKRLLREAAEEEARNAQAGRDAKMDMAFDAEFYALSGLNPSEIAEYGKNVPDLVNLDEAMDVIKRGKREYKKGNAKKAEKIMRSNADVKKIAKAAQKGKGCAVMTLASASLSLFGLYWATSRVIELVTS